MKYIYPAVFSPGEPDEGVLDASQKVMIWKKPYAWQKMLLAAIYT
ncbi:hypothetical protein P7H22_24570 [Paenibacillus larvae]|nr:hypothetical protein [Paenibacillus larvae]MDT2242866.1 hypothetical protein [Paenibacillus larvae]